MTVTQLDFLSLPMNTSISSSLKCPRRANRLMQVSVNRSTGAKQMYGCIPWSCHLFLIVDSWPLHFSREIFSIPAIFICHRGESTTTSRTLKNKVIDGWILLFNLSLYCLCWPTFTLLWLTGKMVIVNDISALLDTHRLLCVSVSVCVVEGHTTETR